MPMHDWQRVTPNVFHDFHGLWLIAVRHALNRGVLPAGYYALYEQATDRVVADLLTLRPPELPRPEPARRPTAAPAPAVGLLDRAERLVPKRPARRLVVRHSSGHDPVAVVELVSPANKTSKRDFQQFVEKAARLLTSRVNLLVVDPFPPTPRDPGGVHPAIWAAATKPPRKPKPPYHPPADRPLTAASYQAGDEIVAAVEAFAVGGPVPDMPLWLADDLWVTVPLERTYAEAFADVPAVWRQALEGDGSPDPAGR